MTKKENVYLNIEKQNMYDKFKEHNRHREKKDKIPTSATHSIQLNQTLDKVKFNGLLA